MPTATFTNLNEAQATVNRPTYRVELGKAGPRGIQGPAGDLDATIFDAKGELIGASAADTAVRVPAGTSDAQVLWRDSSTASGLAFKHVAAPSYTFAGLPSLSAGDLVNLTDRMRGLHYQSIEDLVSITGAVNPEDFAGFDPTGATVSTTAMQAAIDTAKARLQTHTPTGAGAMGSLPTVAIRGGSIVDIDAALVVTGYFRIVSDGQVILRQRTTTEDILNASDCYMLLCRGVEFSGGKRWVHFGNNNTNSSQAFFDLCGFGTNNAAFGIELEPLSPAVNLSCQFILRDCKIRNPYQTMKVCAGAYVKLVDSWIQTGANAFNGAQFENRGSLVFDHTVLIPGTSPVLSSARWIDNHDGFVSGSTYGGWVKAINGSRFGGEGGGIPFVRNFAGPFLSSPYVNGGSIIADSCEISIGPDAGPKYLIHCTNDVLPQVVSITNCQGLSGVGELITDDFDVATYLAGLHSTRNHLWWKMENNAAWPEPDGTRVPIDLFSAPRNLHWSAGSPVRWTNVASFIAGITTVAGFRAPRYRRRGDEFEMEGIVRNTSGGTIAVDTQIFTDALPVGFRPVGETAFNVNYPGSGVYVTNTGLVKTSAAIANNAFVSVWLRFSVFDS